MVEHQTKIYRTVLNAEGRHIGLQLGCLRAAGALTKRVGYRGMSRLAHVVGNRVFDASNSVILAIEDFGRLRVVLRDGYWINLLFADFRYEPEVAFVLEQALTGCDACFVDCGANIGYWSMIASSLISEPGRVVAIEASPPVFERLVDNAALNENRFQCLPLAVWASNGETLEIVSHEQRHAGSSVVSRRGKRNDLGYRVDEVPSITLDAICDRYISHEAQVVLKLDVEGAEVAALRGASNLLLSRHPLVVYEDHGNDPESLVSQHILADLGMQVFYCDDRFVVERILHVSRVREIKTDSKRGYNFFACSPDSQFLRLLNALVTQ